MSTFDVPILYIIGSGDDSDRIAAVGATKIHVSGASDLHKLLEEREPYELLHVSRNFFRQTRETRLLHYNVLVNLITEAEKSTKTLDNLRKLLRGVPGRVINPPDAVLRSTRDRVARLLTGIPGLIVPKAVRIQGNKPAIAMRQLLNSGINPPIILRQAGTHGGKIIGRFDIVEGAVSAIEPNREHVATEFIDFGSDDGLYRKYRVFFIGQGRILRHMLVSEGWNVHASTRSDFMAQRPELVAEERALMESDEPFPSSVRAVLKAIRDRMPLDFFGLDFGLTKDGQVVLFEANATMSFFPFSPDPQFAYSHRCVQPAQAAFREMLGLPPQMHHATTHMQTV
jgi:glutathione synthase/RimK-type ligase-like ATP-grasp enzyme